MEVEDAYRIQDLWAEARIAKGAPDGRPQDRPDFKGDADGLEDDGAGLRPHPRMTLLNDGGDPCR